ncbi:MAG: 50S ribosomal protein L25 [Candidatus Omnitrophica bacterium]|nr:50S ribosomal protein L25 [Candidatus Omnitrophota bacterium]
MEEIFLDVEPRKETGRAATKDLKEAGFIPAVVYGQGKESFPIKVSHHLLLHLVHQYRIEGVVINLKVKDDKKEKTRACLIKEIQYHPVHGDIIHVDFNEISLTKAIKVNIPVVATGESVGVKQDGGSLEHILWEVEIECLPTNIPKNIEVDITQLKIGDSVHVKDLNLPSGAKILNDPGSIVLSVAEPMKEEAPAETAEGEVSQEPEVIKEKKEVPVEAEAEAKEEKGKKEKEKEKEK